jgi:hypothetical protein
MRSFILVVSTALVCAAVAHGQTGIRSVDFKNFTYPAYCIGEKPENITVKDGEFYREKQEDGYVDRFSFNVFDIAYGDVTGDGAEEAIVLSVCNTGGTGNFSEGYVYSMKAGKPVVIARIPGGDRAYGGLRSTRVEGGLLTVESNDVGDEGGACCPQFVVTTKYRVSAGKLIAMGQPSRKDLFPKQRVTFARGTTGATLDLTLPAGELQRYVVGARAGQVLRVSTGSPDVSVRLLEEAPVTEGVNGFSARLPRSGDYTVQIENTSSAEVTIKVNIKIQ